MFGYHDKGRTTAGWDAVRGDSDPFAVLAEHLDEHQDEHQDEQQRLVTRRSWRSLRRDDRCTRVPIDPTADQARRAWMRCPHCRHGADCRACQDRRNCADHWQYLLSNHGTLVNLQCVDCGHLWSTDTGGYRPR